MVGKLLVSFCPGDVVGYFSEGEDEIKDIAFALGDLMDRVFDIYYEFSNMADKGILLRKEYGNQKGAISVSFYYLSNKGIPQNRQQIVNYLLHNYHNSSVYPRPGLYVAKNNKGNYKLVKKKKEKVESFELTLYSGNDNI